MAIQHKLQYVISSNGQASSVSGYGVESPNAEVAPGPNGLTFPASSTNVPFTLALTAADLQSVFLLASQNCTIKTNSTGSPANTINLVAGIPLAWEVSANYFTCPFTANVTGAYLTCTAATVLKYLIGTL